MSWQYNIISESLKQSITLENYIYVGVSNPEDRGDMKIFRNVTISSWVLCDALNGWTPPGIQFIILIFMKIENLSKVTPDDMGKSCRMQKC